MSGLQEAIVGLERRLRHRRRLGGERLPVEMVGRLRRVLETIENGKPGSGGPEAVLHRLAVELEGCERCDLSRFRHAVVVGEGSPYARLVFVGEGPGEEEDLCGRPFVGPAGQLLTRIIQAMGLSREEVFIANVVKCRPPGNRVPKPEEIETCRPFLFQQIRAISPRIICALGAVAAKALLDSGAGVSKLRGRFHRWEGIRVMPTYHPSYLLRNPEMKRQVWEDMKQIMAEL